MKTVLATYLVWMKDQVNRGAPYPGINLLMVGNEEIGEHDPMGSPHVLKLLKHEGYEPELFIAGERTGERGDELWGQICIENRGVMRFEIIARGEKGHSGLAAQSKDISTRLLKARSDIAELLESHLTLSSSDSWRSQVTFPFIQIGKPGIYNIRPDLGRLGVEIRPIPQDDIDQLIHELDNYCRAHDLELLITVMENGIACDPQNPYLLQLMDAFRRTSKMDPDIGKKLPGTSARFAPRGQGIVWGQSGLNPHAKDERHYIPSILPYYQVLENFSELLRQE
jgi:acetylornithine deacetylase/succinyl-diaminopimelate desuccinylase-like protein